MPKLIFENTGEEAELEENASLAQKCEEAGVPFACTEGICGTCIVEVVSGNENLSEPSEAEINFLGESCVGKERMMCQCKIKKDSVTIRY